MSQIITSLITGEEHELDWSPGFDWEHDVTVPKSPAWLDEYLERLLQTEVA